MWNLSLRGIELPNGSIYEPQTDDLKAELEKAARQAGLDGENFRVFINGLEIEDPAQLPTNSVAALIHQARIEEVEPTARVAGYDKAGA
uniref:Uncharacterized protein n=1 Tax=viral metagenome TaxID=1070528 RepID=A0A6M3LWV0_9ZZZZ